MYHTGGSTGSPEPPQWLKLQLEEPALVSRVVIVNRLTSTVSILQRLLGTRVYLYDGTKQVADCGKITEVNTANGNDVTSQTYTLPCDSPCSTSHVKLEDSEIEKSNDKILVMNIAEVRIYGTNRPLNCHELLASSTPDGQLQSISSATAKTFEPAMPPEFAIDGDPNTFYHTVFKTADPEPPQWLKLQLEEPALVSRAVIVNRLGGSIAWQQPIGCLVPACICTMLMLASYVKLEDSEMEESYDAGISHLTMSIAEVLVYGRVPPNTG
eukprot:sb/3468208/